MAGWHRCECQTDGYSDVILSSHKSGFWFSFGTEFQIFGWNGTRRADRTPVYRYR